jgi:hypothetical protein
VRLFPALGRLASAAGRTSLLDGPFSGDWTRRGASIRRAVVAALRADDLVVALVGDRIFDRYVSEDVLARPALVCRLINITRPRNLSGPDGTAQAHFRFSCVSKEDSDGEALAEAVRLLFDGLGNQYLTVPGGAPIYLLVTYSVGDDDSVFAAEDGGEPMMPTSFDYVFRYREAKPRPRHSLFLFRLTDFLAPFRRQ